jgi:UDP-N-acetylmuramate--alanine ligase
MLERPKKIYISGIAGSGLSAIATFMADKGHTVIGSDRAFDIDPDHPLLSTLNNNGIVVVPQDGSGIDRGVDIAVFSTAVEHKRPDHIKAVELGIPVITRPEYLARIIESYATIAISGTSGKSTTAGMLAFLMHKLGLDPNFIGGGRVKQFGSPTNPGNALSGSSHHLIFEACESDGTIINYKPAISVILNLSLDHNPIEKTHAMFETFMSNTSDTVILNADDEHLITMADDKSTTFSIDNDAPYRAVDIDYMPLSSSFTLNNTRFTVSMPGKHNIYNALACIAILSELDVPLSSIAAALPEFRGIDRRFDIHLDNGRKLVIDDYAHNPHKIEYLMRTMTRLSNRVCYIFQPHGFGPTRLMKEGYIAAFAGYLRDNDHLILLPIYYTGGTVARDISSDDLASGIRERGRSVEVVEDRRDIIEKLSAYEAVVVFGARDETLSALAGEIARMLGR